jgi:energy-converting hydrogenase A subunit R
MPLICFDLEGPLSPQDNAYEVLGLTENGHKVFEVISRYDDILTLRGRPGYEPGDTLKLIIPFLLLHGITEREIKKVSEKGGLIPGVKQTISDLKENGWRVHIISTSYQQHAYNIASKLGVSSDDVACTHLPLDHYHSMLKEEDLKSLEAVEKRILDFGEGGKEDEMVNYLDRFFFQDITKTRLGEIFREVTIVGGARKVDAMEKFIGATEVGFHDVIAVGDSITDFKMLRKVKDSGGLAIVFNGNEYAIPHGDVGLASMDMRALLPIASAFFNGGRNGALEAVRELENSRSEISGYGSPQPVYNLLERENTDEIIKVHKIYRKMVRGEAGKLG